MVNWCGWGNESESYTLENHPFFLPFLEMKFKVKLSHRPPPEKPPQKIPASALKSGTRKTLISIVGDDNFSEDGYLRLTHSRGKSYKDLVLLRDGHAGKIVDAVLFPKEEGEILKILGMASKEFIEIIPFGGGTTVLGGVTPTKNPSLCVDMMHFKTLDLDEISHTATLGAGLRGPEIEERLERKGFTLGHFPQSFEFSTLGGWVATRSAGQASTKYGKIEDMVLGLRMVTPKGIIRVLPHPASSTGPGLKNLYVGSEGIFGIITSATLRVKSIPKLRDYEGFFFKTFHEGIRAIRTFMQNGIAPAVVRLSDAEETAVSLALSQKEGITKEGLGSWFLQKSGFRCLLILGMEGNREEVIHESEVSRHAIKEFHGLGVGKSAGEAWMRERFRHPYLRDTLLDRGVMIDTLETVTSWNNLEELHRKTKEAIEKTIGKRNVRSIVMAHISHVYETGACLYFTFMAPQTKDKISQWEDVKSIATRTILESGGALSHHHGVGADHAPFFIAEHGKEGAEAVRRTKMLLDPSGILNPGKVLVRTRARKAKGN